MPSSAQVGQSQRPATAPESAAAGARQDAQLGLPPPTYLASAASGPVTGRTLSRRSAALGANQANGEVVNGEGLRALHSLGTALEGCRALSPPGSPSKCYLSDTTLERLKVSARLQLPLLGVGVHSRPAPQCCQPLAQPCGTVRDPGGAEHGPRVTVSHRNLPIIPNPLPAPPARCCSSSWVLARISATWRW